MPLPTNFNLQPGQKARKAGSKASHPADTTFAVFVLPPDTPHSELYYANAEKLARSINAEPGHRTYCFVNGSFIFGDFIEAFIVVRDLHVKRLLVTALSVAHENVDSLRNLLTGGYVDDLGLIISDYNFSHNRYTLMPYLAEQLGYDGRLRFAAARNHSKIALIETHDGRQYVLHGSANLVSSGNIEQFSMEENPVLFAFNADYLEALLSKYNVLNAAEPDIRRQKPLTKAQTWQPAPLSTNT